MRVVYTWEAPLRTFPSQAIHRVTSILELMHIDLYDSMQYPTLRGARYFMLIIDDFSRKVGFTCVQPNLKPSLGFKNGCLVETETSKKV